MNKVTRRQFIQLASMSLGVMALRPFSRPFQLPEFPRAERLGRVNVGAVDLKVLPDEGSASVGKLYEDAVVPWIWEIVGKNIYRTNQRWVETPGGYIWSPYLQPVKNEANRPVQTLEET